MPTEDKDGSPRGSNRPARGSLVAVAQQAVEQFSKLSGRVPESVTGVKAEGDGWSLLVDVVELERTPPTMSVLATYRVDSDRDGNLASYERLRRFTRSTTDD
jgi:hypothetical protein